MATLTHFTNFETELDLSTAKWQAAFPGDTAALNFLRESLILADCTQLESRTAFHQLSALIEATAQPMHEWHPKLLRHFDRLKRRYQVDNRHCTRALRALQTAHAAYQLTSIPPSLTKASPTSPPASSSNHRAAQSGEPAKFPPDHAHSSHLIGRRKFQPVPCLLSSAHETS